MRICAVESRKLSPAQQFLSHGFCGLPLASAEVFHHVMVVGLEHSFEVFVGVVIDARIHWEVVIVTGPGIAFVVIAAISILSGGGG